jgi:hypothetical protein
MDLQKRAALINTILAFDAPRDIMPVVPLEAFFDGNDDLGSIGCNLPEHPGTQRFWEALAAIKARPEVQDVLVGIYEIVEDETSWPFSQTVYVLTTANAPEVQEWVAELVPDEVTEGFLQDDPPGMPSLRPGTAPVRLWWDYAADAACNRLPNKRLERTAENRGRSAAARYPAGHDG